MTEGQIRYREFLKSDFWAGLKKRAKRKRCKVCNTRKNLDLHHTSYPSDWYKTNLTHVCWLCRRCHSLFHTTFGIALPNPKGKVGLALRAETKREMRKVLKQTIYRNPDQFGKQKPRSVEEIEAAKTPRGGWKKQTLCRWGVAWPPKAGWKQRLIAEIKPE